MSRLPILCVLLVAALLLGGCNKTDKTTVADTEGPYVTVDEIKYQIQISRILNPDSPGDAAYLSGVPDDVEPPTGDEVWYGIFLRSQNDKEKPYRTAREFVIHDTQGAEYKPIKLDPASNAYVYRPTELQPGKLDPALDTAASDNTIRGSLLLFKVTVASLAYRPLEFEIASPSGGENAIVDIDV